jgi:hypothetical protein
MQLLFLGGPLDGLLYDVEPPLTETVVCTEDRELESVEDYEPPVRPYFLHTVLTDRGPVPMYSTATDWNEFANQLYRFETEMAVEPYVDPADLPVPATMEMTVWIPREN